MTQDHAKACTGADWADLDNETDDTDAILMRTDDVSPYVICQGTRSAVVPATEGSNEPDASKPGISGRGFGRF